MAYKRMTIRLTYTQDFSVGEQQTIVSDAAAAVDGTGIGGYIVSCDGYGWLEWEGNVDAMSGIVPMFLDDARFDSFEVIEDELVDTQEFTDWRGHTEGDTYIELP